MTKKKTDEVVVKKTETVEEFLARGGKVTVVPYEEPPETKHVIRSTTGGLPTLMSLDEGQHFFGETRKKVKKPITKDEFNEKVSNSNLPADIIASLKKSMGTNDE